jgi:dTDP-4-dehydrorhamnose 3,5-epimerase
MGVPSKLSNLRPSDIDKAFAAGLTTQTYAAKTAIEGVKVADLRQLVDDGGMFAEVLRLDENGFAPLFEGFQVRQVSLSVVLPGVVKAFHLHFRQDDVWFVPPADRMLVGLIDARADSPTTGAKMRLVLGAGRAQLLFIPRGVAHGVVNHLPAPGTVFYFVNQQFDIDDPDERRLPWDTAGADFWQATPG